MIDKRPPKLKRTVNYVLTFCSIERVAGHAYVFSLLQACAHLRFALADELLLDCVDAWQRDAFEHCRDDSLEELLAFLKLLDACVLDTAVAGGVVDFHFVRCILVGLHAVSNQVDVEVPFAALANLDVRFDLLSHGKVIGCNLIEFVKKLSFSTFRHFLLIDSDLECLPVVLSCLCFDCA